MHSSLKMHIKNLDVHYLYLVLLCNVMEYSFELTGDQLLLNLQSNIESHQSKLYWLFFVFLFLFLPVIELVKVQQPYNQHREKVSHFA